MTTEQALDLAYENPFTAITVESIYDFNGKYFYYDDNENLKNQDGDILYEEDIYKIVKGSKNEDFNEWIEIDVEISENTLSEDPDYYGDDEDEWN